MSQRFTPLQIGPLRLANRIVVAPMCQYSAVAGNAGNWHLIHLGSLALSSAGPGAQVQAPPQYWRSQPRGLEQLFEGAAFGAG